jgi:histidinol-phosphate aminotransferase
MNGLPANVAALRPYESARSLRKGEGWVFLDANESPAALPAAIGELATTPINRYPDPTSDTLREAVAAFYGVSSGQVMMANGSDELIDLVVRSFVRPGRKVAALSPSYGMYRVSAETNGAPLAVAPLAADFAIDQSALDAALAEADVLFLCSPNNPTGAVVERPLIERLVAGFGGLIVVDEAYGEFADAEGVASSIELVAGGADNLLVLRTFSKAFGAAGIRLGYGVAHRAVIEVLLRMKPPYNVNVLTQTVGLALWRQREAMEQSVRRILAERERLMAGCRRLGCEVFASRANFFLLRPPDGVMAKSVYDGLTQRRRLVVRWFGGRPGLENLLRISVGRPEENDLFLTTLAELLP